MGYSMATRNDMKYQVKNNQDTQIESDKKYPNTFMGNMKMAGEAIKTILTGGSPTEPPRKNKR